MAPPWSQSAILAKTLEELGRDDEASALRQERIKAGTRDPVFYNDEAVLACGRLEDLALLW